MMGEGVPEGQGPKARHAFRTDWRWVGTRPQVSSSGREPGPQKCRPSQVQKGEGHQQPQGRGG